MSTIYITFGFLIIIICLLDFLFTTLSCNGSGKLTSLLNSFLEYIFSPTSTKKWLGLIFLLTTLFQWIFLILLGGFLVFLGSADLVVNAQTQNPAGYIERLYYTGYVFSTLGNGDLAPGSNFSRIFTFTFSIIGFGMLTVGITYLLSVMQAALAKKNLAVFISTMGSTPIRLYRYFTVTGNAKMFLGRIDSLIEFIDVHSNNHLSYPIVHYFLTSTRKRAVAVHLTSLYETSQILKIKFKKNQEVMAQLHRLEMAIINYLEIADYYRVSDSQGQQAYEYRSIWEREIPEIEDFSKLEDKLGPQFSSLLISQGWQWKDVYKEDQ